ncbi:MAG: hypothetical protein A4E52_00569 [Pelotomaculum sp. PtaB.Bin013]|uniref:Uncharacterized protein n=1 Tax=Pelotomaculum isophthalicicum JI TaxID=947010 RepID=A0A9X4H3C2_9FIRM|nr:hypothetical protein [Pelotomaculum isophthalicicum]MDF9409561.1 hypothetical protein [Pelotomaculum isophthalicicum JI]OPX91208.1 MAG: hypothetical protein A4E52_00569 [Pelotomaculum sp. PtaB.Bin013]
MDQFFQLQRQIQDLRNEVNSISQVAGQLQRSEANHAAQLQQMSQSENAVTQQLQTIQQLCNRLNQDVNVISSITQQIPQMAGMQTSGQFGAGTFSSQLGTGQFGYYNPTMSSGQYGPSAFGTFGAQFGGGRSDEFARNQQISQMAANRYGLGFAGNDFATNQHISNMANQGMLGSQSNLGMSAYGANTYGGSTFGTGLAQGGYSNTSAGNYAIVPSHPVSNQSLSSQYGVSGFAGSQYTPTLGSFSTSGQMGSGLANQSLMGMSGQNIGQFSNF